MARFAFLAILAPILASFVVAAPMPAGLRLSSRAITLQSYPEFQISSTVAGDAKAEAEAVFVSTSILLFIFSFPTIMTDPSRPTAPFAGVDLATVTAAELKTLNTMRTEANKLEKTFNAQIATATGADGTSQSSQHTPCRSFAQPRFIYSS